MWKTHAELETVNTSSKGELAATTYFKKTYFKIKHKLLSLSFKVIEKKLKFVKFYTEKLLAKAYFKKC